MKPQHHRFLKSALSLLSVALLPSAVSTTTFAGSWKQDIGPLRSPAGSGQQLSLHPFAPNALSSSNSFRLFQGGTLRFDQAVRAVLRDGIVDSLIEIRSQNTTPAFGLKSGTESQDFRFFVGGIPLCDYQVRAHSTAKGDSFVLGYAPTVAVSNPIPASDWPNLANSYRQALLALEAEFGATGTPKLVRSDRCIRVVDESLVPVWQLAINIGGYPHEVLADAYTVYRADQKFFDVTGKSKVFPFNINDSTMKEFSLPNLAGNGTLTGTYLTTYDASGGTRANNTSNEFIYAEGDDEFVEVSAYTHTQSHLSFFEDLGFSWYGPKPLQIRVHEKPRGDSNNALFIPAADSTSTPTILVGDGDGDVLANLGTDGDVVSHELGHFILYQTLTTTTGESLVLHEGLADFFAFARTGNACLGETICPAGDSSACWPETVHECLRTGETTLTYGSTLWESLKRPRDKAMGHLHGQAISGLLWDMRKSNAVPAADVTKLVFKAISYLGDASGFRDFMLSLFLADKELYESKNFDAIRAAIVERGFESFISDIKEAGDGIPLPTGDNDNLQTETTTTTTKKSTSGSDSNPFKCGVLGTATSAASSTVLGLLLACLPLLIIASERLRRQKVPAVARRPKSKRKSK